MILMMLVNKLNKKKDEELQAIAMEAGQTIDEETLAKRTKAGFIWRIGAFLLAIIAIVTFLLTEDIRNPMVWVCEWTPLMITYAMGQVLVMLGLRQTMRNPDSQDWDDQELLDNNF